MKKMMMIFIALTVPLMLFGRSLKVVCTTVDIADIVKNVGGNRVETVWLMDGTQDPHSVEPRPSMVIKVRDADAVCVIGMDLDMWMNGVIAASRNKKIQKGSSGYIDMSVNIKKLEVPSGKVDGSMGDVHIYGNPHYQLDPENGIIMAKTARDALSVLSPDDAAYFSENCNAYITVLEKNIIKWKERMAAYKDVSVLPTHNCWLYFITAFEMNSVGYLETKPGIAPTPKDISVLAEKMKKQGTKIIIAEPFYPSAAIDRLSEMTGAKVVRIPSSTLGKDKPNTFIGLFDYDIEMLEKALK